MPKHASIAQKLTESTNDAKSNSEAKPHSKTVKDGVNYTVFEGKCLRSCKYYAVYNDKGDEKYLAICQERERRLK